MSHVHTRSGRGVLAVGLAAGFVALGLTGEIVAGAGFGGEIPEIAGTPGDFSAGGIRRIVVGALLFVLDFVALLAVIGVVVAGMRLVISQGDEDAMNRSKKTILYVVLGLLAILFARVIVGLFTAGAGEVF